MEETNQFSPRPVEKRSGGWIWLIVVIVVIGLGIGAYFIFFGGENSAVPTTEDSSDLQEPTDSVPQENLSDCNQIENQFSKDFCLREVATIERDFSICDMIFHKEQSQDNLCYRDVAKERKDSSVCQSIDNEFGYKDDCLLGSAIGLSDSSICEEIVSSIEKDECYLTIAVQKQDPSICDKIVVGGKKDTCLLNIEV